MRNLANYISLSRIGLSVLMLFTEPLSFNFFAVFIICGISDIADGYIARNYGLSSDLGAKLDSIADMAFFLSFITVLLPVMNLNTSIIIWIMVILAIRIISIYIGFMKFNRFVMLHSYLNKLTGLSLILLPFLLLLTQTPVISAICLIATLASLEELTIIAYCKRLDLNCRGIVDLM